VLLELEVAEPEEVVDLLEPGIENPRPFEGVDGVSVIPLVLEADADVGVDAGQVRGGRFQFQGPPNLARASPCLPSYSMRHARKKWRIMPAREGLHEALDPARARGPSRERVRIWRHVRDAGVRPDPGSGRPGLIT